MSSYTNTNNGPPMVNGMSPVQQMQRQPPQQQLQQNQQNSGLPIMSPVISANMSKYMPPSSNVPAPYPTTSMANYVPQSLNGPQKNPAVQQQMQAPITNNMPPNLRPPILNGPGSGNNLIMNGASTNAAASGNSSRTASPSIQFSNQQQREIKPSGLVTQPPTSAATHSKEPNINSLAGNIQNLNLNPINGPMPPTSLSSQPLQMPFKNDVPTMTQQQQMTNNLQVSFFIHVIMYFRFKLQIEVYNKCTYIHM